MSGVIKLTIEDPEGDARLKRIEDGIVRLTALIVASEIILPHIEFQFGPDEEQETQG